MSRALRGETMGSQLKTGRTRVQSFNAGIEEVRRTHQPLN